MSAILNVSGVAPRLDASARMAHGVVSLLRAYARWRARRRDIAYLHTFSDAMLRDIGIHRCEIEGVVRAGRIGLSRRSRSPSM